MRSDRLGACATTTKFFDNKISTFKILLSWRFPRKKNSILDDFPLCHQGPPPSKTQKIIFIVISPSLKVCPDIHCAFRVKEVGASKLHSITPAWTSSVMDVLCQRIEFWPPPPTLDFLSQDFCLQPGLGWKSLLRRTWSGQKLFPLQFSGLSLPY